LERQQQQGRQWFASEAMQTQAPQALEAHRNPPQNLHTPKPVTTSRYSPPWAAEQVEAALLKDIMFGYQRMLARRREWATQRANEAQAALDEAGIRQQELLKELDAMVNPDSAEEEEAVLIASAETEAKQYDVQPSIGGKSYTARAKDAQLLPQYKYDKTQFPTSPKGKLPDITARYDAYVRASISKYEVLRKQYGAEALMQFGTGKVLDLKGQYGLPKAGQFARVHGQIVTDAWLANAQYGEVMREVIEKYPQDIIKYGASKNIIIKTADNPIGQSIFWYVTRGELGSDTVSAIAAQYYSFVTRKAPDQVEDQMAIEWGAKFHDIRKAYNRE
jgi:hypothetical protein